MYTWKSALINREGRQIGEIENYDTLHGVSTLLWEKEIPHATKLNTDDGLFELEIEVGEDTIMELLKNFIITADEYGDLYQRDVDLIILV
jgi:hypothetical protein